MSTFDPAIYASRRARVCELLGSSGVAVFPAGHETIRSHDTEHPFRASSDVLYLTGFEEPETILVLAPGHELGPTILFVRPRDPEKETWTGRRAGVEGAKARWGADSAFELSEVGARLEAILSGAETLWTRLGSDPALDASLLGILERLRNRKRQPSAAPTVLRDTRDLLHPLRLIKAPEEIDAMRRACAITAEAHTAAMQACRPGLPEYALQAVIEFVFKRHGAAAPSYNTIVGAGVNATILHYIENNAVIQDGDLVLIDAGAELHHYAADITRTFPANGRFTGPQRDLYQLVLEAEEAAIAMCAPGGHWKATHDATIRRLTQGLVDLGILQGEVDGLIESEAFKRFYMHGTGHWLGIDVHDVGPYFAGQEPRPFEPGHVQTIEPGLYIPDAEDIPAPFRGIGIRVEDDVLTTADGVEILTAACPKSIEALEALVGAGWSASI